MGQKRKPKAPLHDGGKTLQGKELPKNRDQTKQQTETLHLLLEDYW